MVKWCDKTRDKLSNTGASVLGEEIRSKWLSWLCLGLTGRGLEVWRNECVMPELHRRWGRFPWSGSTPPAADPTSVYSASSYDQLVQGADRAQQRQRQLLPPALPVTRVHYHRASGARSSALIPFVQSVRN